ncbi:uncharacterized protein I206_107506 [Kwoniella pini CBS 10737]|uniref:DUF6534 domain-containing protein n=1 Tax=Kwoniella pini CBS 10737 TaxID=1296096 RepID=A0A1B9HXI8_9TREE|nr:uncharacterized protein I206_05834 [Kwoniella pini CBS 10737]OCF47968.1 hypothetical protein I206_05834 [Kwoniella pini CBS 10737]
MAPTVGISERTLFAIYGPLEIGALISVFGFGLLLMHAFVYFGIYSKGGWKVKLLIIFVVVLCLGQTVSDCSRIIKLTTIHSADLVYFLTASERPEEIISPILSVTISTITQLFLLRRCLLFTGVTENPTNRSTTFYKLKVWGLAGFSLAVISLSFATGIGVPIRLRMLENIATAHADRHLDLLTIMWLSTSSAIDILLSGYIIFKLRNAVKHSEDRNKVVDALIKLSFQAGGLVTALQLSALIIYLKATSTWADFPAIFISKVYAITLISSISTPRRQASRLNLSGQNAPGHQIPCISSPTIVASSCFQRSRITPSCSCGCQNGQNLPLQVDPDGAMDELRPASEAIEKSEIRNVRDNTLVMSSTESGMKMSAGKSVAHSGNLPWDTEKGSME